MEAPTANAPSLLDLGYLSEDDTAALLGVKKITLRNWRCADRGPPWSRTSRNHIVYAVDGVRKHLAERTVTPGADSAPTMIDGTRKRRDRKTGVRRGT